MRCENVEVKFKIHVNFDKPDLNCYRYSKDAIVNACDNTEVVPIIIYNSDGEPQVVGETNKIELIKEDDAYYIVSEGILWHGGTSEIVKKNSQEVISSMTFENLGIPFE